MDGGSSGGTRDEKIEGATLNRGGERGRRGAGRTDRGDESERNFTLSSSLPCCSVSFSNVYGGALR